MFDIIMQYVATGILLLLSVIGCVFLLACLYPRLLLKPGYRCLQLKARGIRRYTFPTGRAITYQPGLKVRPYINSYVLAYNEGKKLLKCELDETIYRIRYEIVVFDTYDRVIEVLQVSERIAQRGATKSVLLPADTAYVHLVLRAVNGEKISSEPIAVYSKKQVGFYFVAVILTIALELLFLKSNLLSMLKNVLRFSDPEYSFTFWTALFIGAAYAGLTYLLHRSKNTRIEKETDR